MRAEAGASASRQFLVIYIVQAVTVAVLSLPFLAAVRGGPLDAWAIAGAAVWTIAVLGESIADSQLAAFRARPSRCGDVCREGLWGWSRHPNYFFEWLHWWSYTLIGHGALLTWIGPIGMLWLLWRVSGIPHTERQALRTRGDRYRDYIRTTSPFIPWPPNRTAASTRP